MMKAICWDCGAEVHPFDIVGHRRAHVRAAERAYAREMRNQNISRPAEPKIAADSRASTTGRTE